MIAFWTMVALAIVPAPAEREETAVAALEKLGADVSRAKRESIRGRVYKVTFSARKKCQVKDADLKHLAALPELEWLIVVGQKDVTGEGLKYVKDLKKLEHIDLARSAIKGESLAHLAGMKQLVRLGLWDTDIDDAGLAHLKDLKNLEFLFLTNARIGDEGIKNLGEKPKVMDFRLGGTRVTDGCLPLVKKQFPQVIEITAKETKITPAGAAIGKTLGIAVDFTSKY